MTTPPPSSLPVPSSASPAHAVAPVMALRADQAVHRGPALNFLLDGQPVAGFAGESVAAALFAAGVRNLRVSPREGQPRGAFCLMGSCQECLVWVGSRKVAACQVAVVGGLEVETLPHREQRLG